MPDLIKKSGDLGLLGLSISEEFGGMNMSFNTSMLIADIIGITGSFSTAYGAHTGIATLPLNFYGTDGQKKKYFSHYYCYIRNTTGASTNKVTIRKTCSSS